jgi:hypothetical protein
LSKENLRIQHDVRSWYGLLQPHPKDDRICETWEINLQKGRKNHGQMLRMRRLQSCPGRNVIRKSENRREINLDSPHRFKTQPVTENRALIERVNSSKKS